MNLTDHHNELVEDTIKLLKRTTDTELVDLIFTILVKSLREELEKEGQQ